MSDHICLSEIGPGQQAVVKDLLCGRSMRRRLMELGLTPGSPVACLGRSPFGDPSAYLIRGAVIALRRADCDLILVQPDINPANQGGEEGNGSYN